MELKLGVTESEFFGPKIGKVELAELDMAVEKHCCPVIQVMALELEKNGESGRNRLSHGEGQPSWPVLHVSDTPTLHSVAGMHLRTYNQAGSG